MFIILAFLSGALAGVAYTTFRQHLVVSSASFPPLLSFSCSLVNGVLWVLCYQFSERITIAILYCLMSSVLLVVAIIDARTGEIPFICSLTAFVLGVVILICDITQWRLKLLGMVAVACPLFLLLLLSKGHAIGGGDVKLLVGCGLFLGWKLIILAFLLACILGSLIHLFRMRFFNAGRYLALGPYLSVSVFICMLWGNDLLNAYLRLFQ